MIGGNRHNKMRECPAVIKLSVLPCKPTALCLEQRSTSDRFHERYKKTELTTRWFKYDRDNLCVNKSQLVPVIFEPPCTICCTTVLCLNVTYKWTVVPMHWGQFTPKCNQLKILKNKIHLNQISIKRQFLPRREHYMVFISTNTTQYFFLWNVYRAFFIRLRITTFNKCTSVCLLYIQTLLHVSAPLGHLQGVIHSRTWYNSKTTCGQYKTVFGQSRLSKVEML
jgi:hypothetical protein